MTPKQPSGNKPFNAARKRPAVARFVRLPEVMQLCGLSRSSIYQKMADGSFPAQIKISMRSVAWLEGDVIDWIEAQC